MSAIFYNIAMSKARRIRKISVFTVGGKFSVFTLSYVNTALNQSAFTIHKCYIIRDYIKQYKSFLIVRKKAFQFYNNISSKRGHGGIVLYVKPLFSSLSIALY